MSLTPFVVVAAATAGAGTSVPLLGTAYEGSRVGSLFSFVGATRGGSAATSALINAGSQLFNDDPFRWSGVVQAGVAGYLGPGGGVGWNVTVNAVTGGAATEFDNYFYGEDRSVLLSTAISGAAGGLGYTVGNKATIHLDGAGRSFGNVVIGNIYASVTSEYVAKGMASSNTWIVRHGAGD